MKTIEGLLEDIEFEKSEAQEKADMREIVKLMSRYYFLKKTRLYKQLLKFTQEVK